MVYFDCMLIDPVKRATQIVGGVGVFCQALGLTRQAIHKWGRDVPRGRCFEIEDITGGQVTRFDLRPDMFPPESINQDHQSNVSSS